ncbi:MAG: RluA family pseudouridine synthase [Bacillota bacterium]|nr:RluA family pseudouridine synthase [Bacillota bacterium]
MSANNAESQSIVAGPLQFTVESQEDQKSLVRVILKRYPHLRSAIVYQALRKRDIKVNGRRLRVDQPVENGDEVIAFLPALQALQQPAMPGYDIIRQHGSVLIINKQPGLSVQAGATPNEHELSLLDLLKRDIDPDCCLCHRLDRQTGGLLIAARDNDTCLEIRYQMQQGLITKRYTCLVRGIPDQGEPVASQDGLQMLEIKAWLEKKAAASTVFIHDQKQPGDLPIVTRYRVDRIYRGAGPDGEAVSALTVELGTGRTHQIRAHFAHIEHPLLGDGKYGRNEYNRHFQSQHGTLKHQELWATTLLFSHSCSGPLAALAGQIIRIEPVFDWKGAFHSR